LVATVGRVGLIGRCWAPAQASTLAEFGTQQLEFVALSHATGDDKYARQSEYIIKVGHAI